MRSTPSFKSFNRRTRFSPIPIKKPSMMHRELATDTQAHRVLRETRGRMSVPSIRHHHDVTMEPRERPHQVPRDGKPVLLQAFLLPQSSRRPKQRRMLPGHSRTCGRARRPRRAINPGLLLHPLLHGLSLPDSAPKPHLVLGRRDSTLVQPWVMSHQWLAVTTTQDQHQSDMRKPFRKSLLKKLPHLPRDHLLLRCQIL